MDGQNYLDQIAQSIRPEKKPSGIAKLLSSKLLKGLLIGVVVLTLIIVIGSAISSSKNRVKELSFSLKLHLDNTAAVIEDYQPKVKSSNLRSSSASLDDVLSNTNRDLTNFLVDKYDFKEKSVRKELVEEATLNKDELESELFAAKINGILDRVYAHKMAYEISTIMAEEEEIFDATNNETLKSILTTSYNSLENLYSNFSDFSETK